MSIDRDVKDDDVHEENITKEEDIIYEEDVVNEG